MRAPVSTTPRINRQIGEEAYVPPAPINEKAPRHQHVSKESKRKAGKWALRSVGAGLIALGVLSIVDRIEPGTNSGSSTAGVDLRTVTVTMDNKACSSRLTEMDPIVLSDHDEHTLFPAIPYVTSGAHVQSGSVNINKDVPTGRSMCSPGQRTFQVSTMTAQHGIKEALATVPTPVPVDVAVSELSLAMVIPAAANTPPAQIAQMISQYRNDSVHGKLDSWNLGSSESGIVVDDGTSADAHLTEDQQAIMANYLQGYSVKSERQMQNNAATAIRQDLGAMTLYHGYKIDTQMQSKSLPTPFEQTLTGIEQMSQDTGAFYLYHNVSFTGAGSETDVSMTNASGITNTIALQQEHLTGPQLHDLDMAVPAYAR